VDLRTGRINGMEALLRWQQPEVGLISPEVFVSLAEHTGLIDSIGEWVLRTACRQARAWHDGGHPDVAVSVNLSPIQLRHTDLVDRVLAIVAEVGLRPSALILEVMESVLIQQVKNASELLTSLRATGIRVSLDDFGTGHSSLVYVKRFPVDEIKIDRSFLMDLPDNVQDAAICSAIVTMAQRLGIHVIAEGVETDAQLRFLQDLQCPEAQGYLFSRPVPREAATELLDKFTAIRRQVWAAREGRPSAAPRAATAEVISILNEVPWRVAGRR
jgi:EAL domain-containing protein (putative c-di-GMP-specific phosphodiesterase class I)